MNLGNQADVKVVVASHGVPFLVRIVRKGDPFGLNWCLRHMEGEDAVNWDGKPKDEKWAAPMVEFYDARYPHTQFGQFVSRYYASTLLGTDQYSNRVPGSKQGLNLHGGEPDWQVDGETMAEIEEWVESRLSK